MLYILVLNVKSISIGCFSDGKLACRIGVLFNRLLGFW